MAEIGFWSTAQSSPDRCAVIDDDGNQTSYGDLAARSNQLAHALPDLGVRQGGCLAALLPNQTHFLELSLATAQSGTYFLPINWHLTASEVAYILADSKAGALIAEERTTKVALAAAETVGLDPRRRLAVGAVEGFDGVEQLLAGQPSTRPQEPIAGEVMLYTSGTTGRPKGIRRPLTGGDPEATGAKLAEFTSAVFGLPPEPGVQLVTGPMYHATPGGLAVLGLHRGDTVVLMDRWDPERTLQLIERHRVTYMHMVPTMFQRLLALPDEVKQRYDTSSLRGVVHGAAPCPADVKRKMIDWWGPVITEYYGSSEGGGASVSAEEWLQRPGTVGRPWPGSSIRILDDTGQQRPPGQPGAVYIKMAGYEFEYHEDPGKTRKNTRDGFFTVGDIGYLDEDGYLFLSGRSAELIISGGVNIYPAEIESRLLEHPAVADAGVIGIPNPEWGEEVKAVVQLQGGVTASPELADQLIEHCRSGLARYKVPRSVDFRDQLPRTDAGKLLKHRLRDEYWAATGRQL